MIYWAKKRYLIHVKGEKVMGSTKTRVVKGEMCCKGCRMVHLKLLQPTVSVSILVSEHKPVKPTPYSSPLQPTNQPSKTTSPWPLAPPPPPRQLFNLLTSACYATIRGTQLPCYTYCPRVTGSPGQASLCIFGSTPKQKAATIGTVIFFYSLCAGVFIMKNHLIHADLHESPPGNLTLR